MSAPPGTMPPPAYGPPPPYAAPPPQKTVMPMVAGILLIIAGVMGIAFWALVAAAVGSVVSILPVVGGALAGIVLVCGAIEIIFGILAVVGGVMALRRKMWGLALVGSILGLLLFAWYGIASLFSLIALIVLVVSHKEFE